METDITAVVDVDSRQASRWLREHPGANWGVVGTQGPEEFVLAGDMIVLDHLALPASAQFRLEDAGDTLQMLIPEVRITLRGGSFKAAPTSVLTSLLNTISDEMQATDDSPDGCIEFKRLVDLTAEISEELVARTAEAVA